MLILLVVDSKADLLYREVYRATDHRQSPVLDSLQTCCCSAESLESYETWCGVEDNYVSLDA